MSWINTSWSPHVCDRIAYGGMTLSKNSSRPYVHTLMNACARLILKVAVPGTEAVNRVTFWQTRAFVRRSVGFTRSRSGCRLDFTGVRRHDGSSIATSRLWASSLVGTSFRCKGSRGTYKPLREQCGPLRDLRVAERNFSLLQYDSQSPILYRCCRHPLCRCASQWDFQPTPTSHWSEYCFRLLRRRR